MRSDSSSSADAPTRPDHLLTFHLGRRVLQRDVARLSELSGRLLAGTERFDARRRDAWLHVVERLCDEIILEQECEQILLWPLLERRAPDAMPYGALRAERRGVRDQVDEARRAARGVQGALVARPAALATTADHARVGVLARSWLVLRQRLDASFGATGQGITDTVGSHVSQDEWTEILDQVRRRRPDHQAAGARALATATPAELVMLRELLGWRLGWARRRHHRRARALDAVVYGAA